MGNVDIIFSILIVTNWTFIISLEITNEYLDLQKFTNLASGFTTVESFSVMECSCYCSKLFCRSASFNKMNGECRIEVSHSGALDTVYDENSVLIQTRERWHLFSGRYYYVGLIPLKWIDAQNECKKKGSNLVKIDNSAKQQWLCNLMKLYLDFITRFKQIWIGGNDLENEGEWVWVSDNSNFVFTAWRPSQPDNYNKSEHCASLVKESEFLWNDGLCFYRVPYICEL